MTYLVARTCTELVQASGQKVSRSIADLRELDAYVLLGDPGSGKSETFRTEAKACDGFYVTARDFLALSPPHDARDKMIFIDGLDESRAGEGDGRTPLDRIRGRLDHLGRPFFRLSCREADWLGASDRHALTVVAPGEQLSVFHLDPLTRGQIREILANDSSVTDPDIFLKQADDRGLAALLQNPQTLKLLIEAVTENQWPSTRQETFRLACEKLAMEPNNEHRNANWSRAPEMAAVLDAAGGLCALQLLADISSFTATGVSNAGLVALRDISCLRGFPLALALKTRLFVGIGEEQFVPTHRSVAEYLAAQRLARAIEMGGLPIGRVLSLMSAADGGTVAGLRGLHAWLAVHHPSSRRRLIEIDPLGIVLYGDTKHFSVDDKTSILMQLRHLARQHTGFRWQDWSAKPFGGLATSDMVDRLKSILTSPSRDEGDQAFLNCALDAVRYGDALPQLTDELRAIVIDATYLPSIRSGALTAYIHVSKSCPDELRRIAEDIRDGKIADASDEMLGHLLHDLFPKAITGNEVFTYLHRPKDDHLIGSYYQFWSRHLAEAASDADVAVLLDALDARTPSILDDSSDIKVRNMVGALLTRGVQIIGDRIADDRLYRWLGVGVDKYGHSHIERDDSAVIKTWLEGRPEQYKSLLSIGIAMCATSDNFNWCLHRATSRFQGAEPPADTGLLWLHHADEEPDQERANVLFYQAVGLFFRGESASGLSFEYLEKWVEERPRFAPAHQHVMYEEIPDWRREHTELERKYQLERQKHKDEWLQYFRQHVRDIRTGLAQPNVLHDLARAYLGLLIEAQGDTRLDRLSNFLDRDEELVSAALDGFKRSLQRHDLPSVAEIIKLDIKGQMHFIRQACLAGLAVLYDESPERTRELPDEVLSRGVAFHYTYAVGDDEAWFKDAVQKRPGVVSDVLVQYEAAKLKTKKDYISGVYPLAHDENFAAVARLAVIPLLRAFPKRARKKQVSEILDTVLKAALRNINDEDLKAIIDERLALPRLDSTQRLYLLAAGLVLAPRDYDATLSTFVGKRRARIKDLAAFFSDRLDRWVIREGVQESSLAYLIRIFAPICSPELPRGAHWVSPAMHTAEFVQSLISRLAGTPSAAADEEIKDLLSEGSLATWHSTLRHAQHAQRVSYREATFRHPTVSEACQTLENGAPANAADLAALVSGHLRDLALDIRHGNTDQYKQFWNVDRYARPSNPRPEDACRDTLLARLRDRLRKLGVEAQPEGHYADDKRADIRVSYATPNLSMAIPIEIKRDSHPDLWEAIPDQLIEFYTRDPESKGRGVFLVFWFGGDGMRAPPKGDKPTSVADLEAKLLEMRPDEKRELISVCVVDCSD